MNELFGFAIRGLPVGCVYALIAISLVLSYRTTGVLNLAFGAQAFVSAAVFYDLRVRHDWATLPALAIAVFLVGPSLGLVLDHAVFRRLRSAPPLAGIVASLGLLVAIPELVKLWFGSSPAYDPPSIAPNPDRIFRFGAYALDGNEVATIALTLVVVAVLALFFRYSRFELRMRAVVESPRLAELAGIDANRVSTSAWMLSGFLAGLAGVLLAPLFAQVNANNFTTLLLAAIAAAAFGRFASIPLTLVGALLLAVLQQVIAGYLPLDSVLAQGLRPSFPFIALFGLLVARSGSRDKHEESDPLAALDPPPLARISGSARSARLLRTIGLLSAAGVIAFGLTRGDRYWVGLVTQAIIYSIIFLSITVLTGIGGQISLCQASFAAVGAFATAQLGERFGLALLPAALIGAILAAAVGALVALPALRLGGIHLALATLAFALMFDAVLVPLDWVGGGAVPLATTRPVLGPVDFYSDRAYLLLCAAALALVCLVVVRVGVGRTGHFLDALRGSETGATSVGIDPTRPRITAFALSAAIAGFGGALLASQQGEANPVHFSPFFGLFWVVLVVTLGSRHIEGAILGAFALVLLPEALHALGIPAAFEFVLFGVGALAYARHPEGVVEAAITGALARLDRLIERTRAHSSRRTEQPPPLETSDQARTPASHIGDGA